MSFYLNGENMKYVVVVLLLAATLPFTEVAHCQSNDSLYFSPAQIQPGDTAVVSLFLRNQSFSVGGFHMLLAIPDSSRARFVGIQRGQAIQGFDYFNAGPYTDGTLGISGIAGMPPSFSGAPLPCGRHELAVIKIAIDDSSGGRWILPILFLTDDARMNIISDSTGYHTANPTTTNGEVIINSGTAVPEDNNSVPKSFDLAPNYPNPFNARTKIDFAIDEPGIVSLTIFDIQGRLIRRLADGYYSAGVHSEIWDGRSDGGTLSSSGIYLYKLTFNGGTKTRKMNFIK